jgi:hypothetical protein
MSTNIRVDVTLRKLQDIIKDIKKEQQSEKETREDLKSVLDIIKRRKASAEETRFDLRTGLRLDRSGVPELFKRKEPAASDQADAALGLCHCYLYSEDDLLNRTITVYSADGSSSAQVVLPLANGERIAEFLPDVPFTSSYSCAFDSTLYLPDAPGAYSIGLDSTSNENDVCFLDNGRTALDASQLAPPYDYNGCRYTSTRQVLKSQYIDRVGTQGTIVLPVDDNSFIVVVINKGAALYSNYQILENQEFTAEQVEVLEETTGRCFLANQGPVGPEYDILREWYFVLNTGTRTAEFRSSFNTESVDSVACFLVGPSSVSLISTPEGLESALAERLFPSPPTALVNQTFERTNTTFSIVPYPFETPEGTPPFPNDVAATSTSTVTLTVPRSYEDIYEDSLGEQPGAESLYSYSISGDVTFAGTLGSYYYISSYEGGLEQGVDLELIPDLFPDAFLGASSDLQFFAELVEDDGVYSLAWELGFIGDTSGVKEPIEAEIVGEFADLQFSAPEGSGFQVVASWYGGDADYCQDQLAALGFSLSELNL